MRRRRWLSRRWTRRRVDPEADVVEEEPAADPADVDAPLGAAEGVERRDRVVPVEADVAGEVVAGPERDADERQVTLDRDLRDRGERAVASRHPEGGGIGSAGELGSVVVLLEDVRLDPAARRRQLEAHPRSGSRRPSAD